MPGAPALLAGRVAIVTGAGAGLGRAYALALAAAGARVVVNDLGTDVHGGALGASPADRVVAEIEAAGGAAVASLHDVGDWDAARELVELAVSAFGDLHVLVTNAGFLRDRTLAKMSEREWDDVIRVHLKGQAGPTCHAMAWWHSQAASGTVADRSIVHVSSASGLRPGFGQGNYGAAKLGILGLTAVAALEGARDGVRANAIAPSARTRMTAADPSVAATEEDAVRFAPAAVAPLVTWLATADCPATGQVFHTDGRRLSLLGRPPVMSRLEREEGWSVAELDAALRGRLIVQPGIEELLG